MSTRPLRVANCSGFYGDRLAAAAEMVAGGPIDVLTGDYLAELTMMLLHRARDKDPSRGYARTFVTQIEQVLAECVARDIRIVVNAGGLNPAGCAEAVRAVARRLDLDVPVAHITGDDVTDRLDRLGEGGLVHSDTGQRLDDRGGTVVTANAYLGGWGIAEALRAGARIVVCPRVSDASLVVGPAAWHHGWDRDDWDALAGAVVAGHVIECGAQATGGNHPFFTRYTGLAHPGFPIAEVAADGSAVITKHPGTGGRVDVDTVTAQLLYEIGSAGYRNPDVVARFDTIELELVSADRVRVSGTRGAPAPESAKVGVNLHVGWRNSIVFELTGLEIDAKARLACEGLFHEVAEDAYDDVDVQLLRTDRPAAPTQAEATAQLRITVTDRDRRSVGRAFSGRAVELALANYPGLHLAAPPGDAAAAVVFWPTLVPAGEITQHVVHADGAVTDVPAVVPLKRRPLDADSLEPHPVETARPPPATATSPPGAASGTASGSGTGSPTVRRPLGVLAGARSGDKAGTANVGLWVTTPAAYPWLLEVVTHIRTLLPEIGDLPVRTHPLPNLLAVNLEIVGLLGEGVAMSTRRDPQAKGLAEHLRAVPVDIPVDLLTGPVPD